MKAIIFSLFMLSFLTTHVSAQVNQQTDILSKVNKKVDKVSSVISIFQPYLLKARQIFYDTKDLVDNVRRSNTGAAVETAQPEPEQTSEYIQNYLPEQTLPVNNPETINMDGTGNWGNQNNGVYGNCLDVLTGTIMGVGEAEESPKNVDIIFIAANGSYQLWSPQYARDEVAAEYTSRSTHESVTKWNDVNESEIAETRITGGQFDKIQTNGQIMSAVKNASNYRSSLTLFGKLEGKVFAVRTELEDRTVYGLIRIVKHYGTEGTNGYLKIQIKSQQLGNMQDGQIDVGAYLRQ